MKVVVLVLVVLFASCRTEENVEPSLDNVVDAVKTIPGFENFNSSALPTVEQGADLAKQKCEKNGGEGAFERAKKGAEIAAECLKNQINTTALQEEMEIARPKGELDTVFKKYCGRTPEVKSCVWNFTETAKPCLEEEERNNVKIIMNITEALLDFICHKEGDRIALFIAAEGPECFKAKQLDLMECMNSTFGNAAPNLSTLAQSEGSLTNLQTLPSLLFGLKECQYIDTLQKCSVIKLEACSDPTPANIVESLFDFIKKTTPCGGILKQAKASAQISEPVNSAATIFATMITTVILMVSTRVL